MGYGDAMIQSKLIGGFDRFLIFDERLAKKYYGEKHSILNQLESFLPKNIAKDLYDKYGYSIKQYAYAPKQYNIRGAIYPWGRVTAVLPYDFSSLIPYAVSYDGGKTWRKRTERAKIKHKFLLHLL